MRIIWINNREGGATKVINLSDLNGYLMKDGEVTLPLGLGLEVLVFDPRPILNDRSGMTFKIDVNNSGDEVTFMRTDKDEDWLCSFRLYNRTEEKVPESFNSSYVYHGLKGEYPPYNATHLKIHEDVKVIRENAFCGWSLLEAVFIPPTVTEIQYQAFKGCCNLKLLNLPEKIDLENVHESIIDGCDALEAAFPWYTPKVRLEWLKEQYDRYPLHKMLCNYNVNMKDIKSYIEEHGSDCLQETDYDSFDDETANGTKMTPLHIISLIAKAIDDTDKASKIIKYIFEQYKDAAFDHDIYGKLPISYAALGTEFTLDDSCEKLTLAKNEKGEYAVALKNNDNHTATDIAIKQYLVVPKDVRAYLYGLHPILVWNTHKKDESEALHKTINAYISLFQNKLAGNDLGGHP